MASINAQSSALDGSLAPLAPESAVGAAQQSLAGTLPPELLTIIFKEIDELVDEPGPQQEERLRQGEVCRAWHDARIKHDEFHVVGDAQTAALLQTFQRDTARAARVEKISLKRASRDWRSILSLSTKAIEVSLYNEDYIPSDALESLPGSLRTLKLDFVGVGEPDWYPDLSHIPSQAALDIQFEWDSSGSTDSRPVVQALTPVLHQVVRLALFDVSGFSEYQPSERGFLETAVSGMTVLKQLEVTLWQIHSTRLPTLVAQLRTLEELRIVDSMAEHAEEVTPSLLTDVLKTAHPKLALLKVAASMLYDTDTWTPEIKLKLTKTAADRGVVLAYVNHAGVEGEDADGDEDDDYHERSGQARLDAMGLSFEETQWLDWQD